MHARLKQSANKSTDLNKEYNTCNQKEGKHNTCNQQKGERLCLPIRDKLVEDTILGVDLSTHAKRLRAQKHMQSAYSHMDRKNPRNPIAWIWVMPDNIVASRK
jgi:hypothetical protein